LQQLFDPREPVADLPMTLFSPTKTPPDILCLYAARALRGFGDGFAIIILPVYLSAIGFSAELIGIVASASLLGTAALTLVTGFIAPRFELRSLFLAGAGLIAFTGLLFPAAETIAPVLLVAFIGSINPSGGDLGMLVPLEHALLTKETADRDRTAVFARYSLIGSLTAAVGSLAAALPEILASGGWPKLGAIKLMFYGYAALGCWRRFFTVACRATTAMRRTCRRLRSDHRGTSSTGWRPCSVWTPLPAASSCSRCWRSGCSKDLISRWKQRAFISSARACWGHFHFRWPPGSPGASASSTRWCSRISPPASA